MRVPLPYFIKAFLTEWVTTGALGPMLLWVAAGFSGGEANLFTRSLSLLPATWVFLLVAGLGYLFAQLATLPKQFYRRYLPLLLFPLLLMLAWAYALHYSDGDYSTDNLPWRITRLLALLPQQLLLTQQLSALFQSLGDFLYSTGVVPKGLHDGIYVWARTFFYDATGLAAGLGLHAAYLFGFFCGVWRKEDSVGSRQGALLLLACSALAVGLLAWQLLARESRLSQTRSDCRREQKKERPAILQSGFAMRKSGMGVTPLREEA